jgi:CRISPR-associated protein Csb2
LAVRYGADRVGLQPSKWAGSDGGGVREWVTATPLMLDGHVHRGRDAASEVAKSLVTAGYPEPAEVEISSTPMVAGGVWRPRHGTLPSGRPRRQMVHARVAFHESVTGPVLAGSMRYVGLGLFLPVSKQRRASHRADPAYELARSAREQDESPKVVEVPQ